ncbi:MAG: glycerol-3-phosphate 1-O-acyltransferase PlsY [Clostridia bacterium]
MTVFYWILAAVMSYLFGSVSFSIIITYIFTKEDIRTHGSGNAGGTNVARKLGTGVGLMVILLDILKCVIPVLIVKYFIPGGHSPIMLTLAGLCCVLGHMFPVFFNFKGGKGAASAAGMVLVVNVWAFITVILVFLIVSLISRYVSLGSICAALSYPVTMGIVFWGTAYFWPVTLLALATGLFIIFMHRKNIVRLLNHTENKLSFKKTKKQKEM